MVLLDCKHILPEAHRRLTTQSNANTLATAEQLRQMAKPVRMRYVLVPGDSDQPEALHALGQRFGGYENIERLELLPYHTYGKHKYETLGRAYPLEQVHEPTHEEIAAAQEILEQYFPVVWTQ